MNRRSFIGRLAAAAGVLSVVPSISRERVEDLSNFKNPLYAGIIDSGIFDGEYAREIKILCEKKLRDGDIVINIDNSLFVCVGKIKNGKIKAIPLSKYEKAKVGEDIFIMQRNIPKYGMA